MNQLPAVALLWAAMLTNGRADVVQAIVPFPAGGPLDTIVRVVTSKLDSPSETFVVDNRAGANGTIAGRFVATARHDGHIWLFADGALLSANPKLYPKDQAFDAERDLTPVAGLVTQPAVLVVSSSSSWRSVSEMVETGKTRRLSYASGGLGSAGHVTMEMFNSAAGIVMTHVAYKGAAPGMVDLMGNQVDVAFVGAAGVIGHLRSGKLRALAVSSGRRVASLPDVPTVAESGFTNFQVQGAYFLLMSSKTPLDVMKSASAKVLKALADDDIQERLRSLGLEPTPMDMVAAGKWLAENKSRMSKLIADKSIKTE